MKLISKILSIFLFSLILVGTLKNSVLLVFYQVDKAAFISSFCVNTNRPQLHCNGQCKLAQLIKEKEQKQATDTLASLQADFLLFCQAAGAAALNSPEPILLPAVFTPANQQAYFFQFLSGTDRPPQYCV
ncbi:hypothetical protein [Flavihumibacter sp. CACIAM 22H1]|uniref:hypothetical protein n=1 Tax=Flavihumibacter sp. CACIAM 22H1 TaxID=1812911 RepID=UPI0007A7F87C|nr:hypothetical protein [Flavihumibacter sp. CACIAM 22H1]KYP13758.1 MAG: hypothetical protein A1D16_18995 [Flavihumibacter sp. CACIAM 22H1]